MGGIDAIAPSGEHRSQTKQNGIEGGECHNGSERDQNRPQYPLPQAMCICWPVPGRDREADGEKSACRPLCRNNRCVSDL